MEPLRRMERDVTREKNCAIPVFTLEFYGRHLRPRPRTTCGARGDVLDGGVRPLRPDKKDVLPPLARSTASNGSWSRSNCAARRILTGCTTWGRRWGSRVRRSGCRFLLIGDQVLIGAGQIPAELPGLIRSLSRCGRGGVAGGAWFGLVFAAVGRGCSYAAVPLT
jgi:hypothetical protein